MNKISNISALFLSVVVPFLALTAATFFLPNVMDAREFGFWRILASVCAFSGIAHLGFVDGIYLKWIEERRSGVSNHLRIPFFNLLWMTLVFSFLGSLYIYYSFFGQVSYAEILLSVFVISFSTNLYSASVNYLRVFNSGFRLTLLLSMQSLVFVVFLFISYIYFDIDRNWVAAVYAASMLITPVILFREIFYLKKIKVSSFVLNGGANFMLGNLGLILFANVDKIYVASQLGDLRDFARYSVASSLIVAAATLGASTGQILLSKSIIQKLRINTILAALLIGVLMYIALRNSINTYLNTVFSDYQIDYSLFTLASMLVFYYSSLLYAKMVSIKVDFYPYLQLIGAGFYIILCIAIQKSQTFGIFEASVIAIICAVLFNIIIAISTIIRRVK
ncbi:hypothetical protein [Deinococcus ficus]|uniref:hypothetical protein n=1 Tax=Deinococcus ficus TaxID=317577 RepID=UPI00174A4DA5|nr:hypothetical protein [Deinococcus ficus]